MDQEAVKHLLYVSCNSDRFLLKSSWGHLTGYCYGQGLSAVLRVTPLVFSSSLCMNSKKFSSRFSNLQLRDMVWQWYHPGVTQIFVSGEFFSSPDLACDFPRHTSPTMTQSVSHFWANRELWTPLNCVWTSEAVTPQSQELLTLNVCCLWHNNVHKRTY